MMIAEMRALGNHITGRQVYIYQRIVRGCPSLLRTRLGDCGALTGMAGRFTRGWGSIRELASRQDS